MSGNNDVLVSAIVPAYKTEKYLDVFLQRIQEQTILDKLEIVLDLNLPSRMEMEIAEKHKLILGSKLKILIQDNLTSISASMNTGILNSRGKFIAIWNVDDLRTPASLANQVALLKDNSTAACAIGPYRKISKFQETNGPIVEASNLTPNELLTGMHLGPFFMFPKQVTNQIGLFDEQLRSGGDFDFAIRLAAAGSVEYTPELLGWYLDEGLGASTKPNSLQPVERTVIEIRYGIFEKIDPSYVPSTYQYSIPWLHFAGDIHKVSEFFPNYTDYVDSKILEAQQQSYLKQSRLVRRVLLKFFSIFKNIKYFFNPGSRP